MLRSRIVAMLLFLIASASVVAESKVVEQIHCSETHFLILEKDVEEKSAKLRYQNGNKVSIKADSWYHENSEEALRNQAVDFLREAGIEPSPELVQEYLAIVQTTTTRDRGRSIDEEFDKLLTSDPKLAACRRK